jgi:hypothetical protein
MNTWSVQSGFEVIQSVGDRVFKRGKIFQAGSYPDKNVTVTTEQLREAATRFRPVPLNIEHFPSVFDGKLGELIAVDIADDGAMFGVTSIPKALHELLGNDPVPVSIELGTNGFDIVGLAFAKNPRVEDAAIFAAFGMENPSQREGKSMKQPTWKEKLIAAFTGAINDIEDVPSGVPATPSVVTVPNPEAEAKLKAEMELREKAEKELADMKAKHEADIAKANDEKLLVASKAFAEKHARDRRITPAQIESVASQYATAIRADNAGKSVFSDDGKINEGTNVDQLEKFLSGLPQHNLTVETMNHFKAIPGDMTKPGMQDDRKKELLAKSSLGRQAMKTQK